MPFSRLASLVTALGCAVIAFYLGAGARDAHLVKEGNEQALAGDLQGALVTARSVEVAPADLRAMLLEARALAALGRVREASRVYAEVADRDPNNWTLHFEWARATAKAEPRASARRMARARALNPRLAGP